jgi:hypothetical protein
VTTRTFDSRSPECAIPAGSQTIAVVKVRAVGSAVNAGCRGTRVSPVHHVTTINRVAEDLGEDEDRLRDFANEMNIEDGAIWVNGVREHGIPAFTDFGIKNLIELVPMYKESPVLPAPNTGPPSPH